MASLIAEVEGLEQEAENELRTKFLDLLKEVEENVTNVNFFGSPNGSPNASLEDLKTHGEAPAPEESTTSEEADKTVPAPAEPTPGAPPAPQPTGLPEGAVPAPGDPVA